MPKKTVTRTSRPATKPASTRKPAPAKSATPAPKNILTAGIRALSDVHEQAVARQGRVFESLLGLGAKRTADDAPAVDKPANPLTAALDPFGFRKFEDVFDQRVARSMQHLDLPTTEAFDLLKAEVERLQARVTALEASGRKR